MSLGVCSKDSTDLEISPSLAFQRAFRWEVVAQRFLTDYPESPPS